MRQVCGSGNMGSREQDCDGDENEYFTFEVAWEVANKGRLIIERTDLIQPFCFKC